MATAATKAAPFFSFHANGLSDQRIPLQIPRPGAFALPFIILSREQDNCTSK